MDVNGEELLFSHLISTLFWTDTDYNSNTDDGCMGIQCQHIPAPCWDLISAVKSEK